jgi:sugar lactone lactonase YvrE
MSRRAPGGGTIGHSMLLCLLAAALALPPVALRPPLRVAAAEPVPARPEIATYAGQPVGGDPTTVAQQPFGVAVNGRNTYVADPANHVVRLMIDQTEFSFAGNGGLSVEGDGGDPTRAQLAGAYAVAPGRVTRLGFQVVGFDVYIADTYGHEVRRVRVIVPPVDSPSGTTTARISTIAGTGAFGFSGDGGPATAAKLDSPYGLAWDPLSDTVYVADTLNNRIRALAPDGTISTVLGSGAPAPALQIALNQPRGLALDSTGRLYIADTANNLVRRYDPGVFDPVHGYNRATATVHTIAGDGTAGLVDGVAAAKARLRQPAGVALDGQGNLYIADTGNNLIRELGSDGIVRTIAGTGAAGYGGDDGPATQALLNAPFGVAVRDDGDLVVADTGNNHLRLVDGLLAADGTHHIHRLAGNGTPSFSGDGHVPAVAQLSGPGAVTSRVSAAPASGSTSGSTGFAPQASGVRYIADTFNQAIRWFTTFSNVQTLAGTGGVAGAVTSGAAGSSHLAYPMGLALDSSGSRLFIADTFNNVIRKVDLGTQVISTYAGTGQAGFSGDGALATNAQLSYPTSVAVDAAGNVFIADAYNARIRRVDALSGKISTVAGTGLLGYTGDGGDARAADLYLPLGIAVDAASPPSLYVTDSFNNRIRRVDPKGVISTVAGDGTPDFSDGLPATTAHLDRPWSVALDGNTLYIADFLNHRVRKVDPTTQLLTTVAGVGTSGLTGDLGKADLAEVDGPRGISPIGSTGALLIADSFNDRTRWVGVTQAGVYRTVARFAPQNLNTLSAAQTVTVTNTGTGLLVLGAVALDANDSDYFLDPSHDACSHARLEPGVSCSFTVAFYPRGPGVRQGSAAIPDDAGNAPQSVGLIGTATAPVPSFSSPSLNLRQTLTGISDPQSLTLHNGGDGALVVTNISVDGSDFVQSNDCPSSLAPGSNCVITVRLKQIPSGARAGSLAIADNATGSPQRIPLTGAVIAPTVSLTPSGLGFTANVGQTAHQQAVQLTNSGEGSLTISAIKVIGSPDFAQTNNCPTVVTPHATCTIAISFTPSGTGQQGATIRLGDDASDSPQQLALVGFGTMPSVRLGPRQLAFSQNLSEPGHTQPVVVTNTGDGPLTISNIAVTGDYRQTNNCPGVVFAGESCTFRVTFTPATTGIRNGSLIIRDDADSIAGSQQVIVFNGQAFAPAVALTPVILAPSVNQDSTAPPQTVILRNTGDGELIIGTVSISGPGASAYSALGDDCMNMTIQPGQTCSVTISFTPHAAGLQSATLTFNDDARGGPQTVALRGVGTGPLATLSAASLNFGTLTVGTTSAPQSVTLTNTGSGPLNVTSINPPTGDFSETNNCPTVLGRGASCTITVTFTPSTTGDRGVPGVTIVDDSLAGGTQTIALNGAGGP